MRYLILLGSLLTSTIAFGIEATPEAKVKFCQERLSSPDALQKIVAQRENQIWFTNQGGIFGSGVCWWHSRFTRAAAYLAVFDPSLPKPSEQEAKRIIHRLRGRKGITVIPGFRNLYDFSMAYGNEILGKLQDWQRSDGLFKASWVKGMTRQADIPAEKLAEKMDELYERVSKGEIVYQMLQMPGIMAHSWLVVGMQKTADGYTLETVDSNFSGSYLYRYTRSMKAFNYENILTFVPYTSQVDEEENMKEKLLEECQQEQTKDS